MWPAAKMVHFTQAPKGSAKLFCVWYLALLALLCLRSLEAKLLVKRYSNKVKNQDLASCYQVTREAAPPSVWLYLQYLPPSPHTGQEL